MGVSQLGYVGVYIDPKDIKAWEKLGVEIIGFEMLPRSAKGPINFRMDRRHHRMTLIPSDKEKGLAYAGWECKTVSEMNEMVKRLERAGVKVQEGTKKEKEDRAVRDLVRFKDPEGFQMELAHGPLLVEDPVHYGRAISGFYAEDQGLGHVVLCTKDSDKLTKFYQDALDFRISDYIVFPETTAIFLHCNPRHHSLALFNEGLGSKPGTLNHVLVQMKSMDDVGRAYDLCKANDIPIVLGLGKHTNDEMFSFYLITPTGFAIEIGYGALEVDDAVWEVKNYTAPAYWGHRMELAPKTPTKKLARGQLQL